MQDAHREELKVHLAVEGADAENPKYSFHFYSERIQKYFGRVSRFQCWFKRCPVAVDLTSDCVRAGPGVVEFGYNVV